MLVAKSTKAKEGSVKEGKLGEGRGEHKRNLKNKVGELSGSQPSHTAVSQQTAVLKKDKSSFLAASSPKDVVIEQRSQPRAQAKRVRDTSSPQTYVRKKKSKTLGDAQGTHKVQTGATDTVTAPSQIQFNVAPINVESQPKSLVIETPNSPTNSLDVDMINTSIPDSPSLTMLGRPKSSATHSFLLSRLIFAHPSSSDCIPTDKLDSSYPSDIKTTHSMDITHLSSISAQLQTSFISSAEDLVVVQSLLGLREKSVLSESLGCSQEKGEEMSETMQSISSILAKESERSPTLVGEGEGVRVGSQGETLMQQKRENERNAGTGAIRMDAIASESMNVQDADREGLSQHPKAVIDSTSLDAKAFTHPVLAYLLLAEQGNDNAERMLNLVHTTKSMMRAKDAITTLPSTAGDVDYKTGGSAGLFGDGSGDSEDEAMNIGGEVGSSSRSDKTALQTTTNASTKKLLQAHLASLQLQQIQGFQHARDVNTMKGDIEEMKKAISDKIDSKLPEATMLDIKRNPKFAKSGNFRDQTASFSKLQGPNCNFAVQSPEKVGGGRRRRSRRPHPTNTSRSTLHNTRNLFMHSKHSNHPCSGRKLAKNIAAKLHAVNSSQQIPVQPSEITESKKQVEQKKKFPRIKKLSKRTKRKLDIVDKELNDQFPKESTPSTTQASKPSVVFEDIRVVDPCRNIHGEPIVPKDEPIEWENIPIPDFNLPILSKPRRTKSRVVKKVKLSPLKSKSVVKA
ncbi:hypothetical protein AgCh_016509 [Apium graveolens]